MENHQSPKQLFPYVTTEKIRYVDTDRQGHVNNSVFSSLLEAGRVELLHQSQRPLVGVESEFVIARMEIDFRGEILWPGVVTIGTRVARLGNSSITLYQEIAQDGRLCACANTVIVHLHTPTRKPQPLTQAAREILGVGAD